MIHFVKTLITPAKAKEYLEANVGNRQIRSARIAQLAKDIVEDRWMEDTAECIKIADTGRILDGQHRLYAIVKANKPVYCHIATGLNEKVFKVIDTGAVRNATDIFRIDKIKNDKNLPSIISFYNVLKEGKRRKSIHLNNKPTNAMLLEQYYEDDNFWQSVARNAFNWYISFAKILSPSIIGGFYAHLYKIDSEKAFCFMNQLATGLNIENDVVAMLRTKLMHDKISMRKMPQDIKIALIIKSWNVYVTRQKIKQLKFDNEREEYPVAISIYDK